MVIALVASATVLAGCRPWWPVIEVDMGDGSPAAVSHARQHVCDGRDAGFVQAGDALFQCR